jgi:predicted Holliday junction resolvase-like endonuclease
MYSLLKTIFISLLIIFLVDNLIRYLKNTFTTKKTKDVVQFHVQKYQNIMEEMQENKEKEKKIHDSENNEKKDLDEIDLKHMNDDLTSFMQNQIHNA